MSNNSNNPYASNTWDPKTGPVNGTSNNGVAVGISGGSWSTNTTGTNGSTVSTRKEGGGEGSASFATNDYGTVVDVSGTAAVAQLRGTTEGKYGGIYGTTNFLSTSASGHRGVTDYGAGEQGSISAVGAQLQVAGELGNAHTGGVGGYVDGKMGLLSAKGQALLGDDGRYQGVALGGSLQASALDGTAGANVTYPIDWVPFVPKGWTINLKGEAEGMIGDAHISGGGYLYRDRADGRGHFGMFAGLGLGLGAFLGIDFSIGPGMTPEQKKAADAAAAKQAAADAKAAAEALVRPIARITDPIGAHSSHFWAYLAMAAVIALTVVACCFCPALILGAGTLASAAIATLTTVSIATGVMQVAGAYVDAKTNPAKMEESGSPCSEIAKGATKTKIEKLFVARIDDLNSHGSGKLKTGAEKVWVEKRPVSRVGETSTCGATKVLKGAKKTLAGGPSCSSGAPNEPGVADDAFFEGTLDVLGKISLYTGIAAGVGGALKSGVMAAGKATVMAGVKTTVKSLAVQGAVMTTMHYATPVIADGVQNLLHVDKVTADAIVNGTMMAGGGVLHAAGGGGKPGMTWKSGVADVKASAAETGTSAMGLLGKGKAGAMDMLGMGKAEPPVVTDDVAGGAREPTKTETTTRRVEEPTAPRDEPTAPRDEPTAPRDEPTAPRDEPTAPRDEPTAPRDEPTAPRDEPTAPREDLSEVDWANRSPTPDEVQASIQRLETEHGIKFGQDFLYTDGAGKGGSGVGGKLRQIQDPNSTAEMEYPKMNTDGYLWEGHHTAVAMEMLGLMGEHGSIIKNDAIPFKDTNTRPVGGVDGVRIMDGEGNVLRGPAKPVEEPPPVTREAANAEAVRLEKELNPDKVATTADGQPLGDLRTHEVMDIQSKVDAFGEDVYVVGSAAKGLRRNVGTDLPLDVGEAGINKKLSTRSDIDYVVANERGDAAGRIGLPDADAKFGVLEVDYINMSNATKGQPTPAIKFSPGKPPEYFSPEAGHIPLNDSGVAGLKRKGFDSHPETAKRIAEWEAAKSKPAEATGAGAPAESASGGADPAKCATCDGGGAAKATEASPWAETPPAAEAAAPPHAETAPSEPLKPSTEIESLAAQRSAEILAKAKAAEPDVTATLKNTVQGLPGSELKGLDFRLKTDESLTRKIGDQAAANPDASLSAAERVDAEAANIKDALRYTVVTETASYSESVNLIQDSLMFQGNDIIKSKNTWGDDGPYRGLNTFWKTPEGQVFELQFHTPESFSTKDAINHPLYEEARLPSTTPERAAELNAQMIENANAIPVPPDALRLNRIK